MENKAEKAKEWINKGKDFTNAVDAYTKAIEETPNDANLLYSRELAYASKGEIDAAIND